MDCSLLISLASLLVSVIAFILQKREKFEVYYEYNVSENILNFSRLGALTLEKMYLDNYGDVPVRVVSVKHEGRSSKMNFPIIVLPKQKSVVCEVGRHELHRQPVFLVEYKFLGLLNVHVPIRSYKKITGNILNLQVS